MIDMHCHILPEMDDGANDMETSLEMCKIALKNGINHIVATPHVNAMCNVNEFLSARDSRLRDLCDEVEREGLEVNLYPGAEVFVDDDIFFASELEKLTINGSKYILVEFNFDGLTIKKLVSYLNEIINRGLIPIVAHPERYEYFQEDYEAINMLARNKVAFQLNAGSLASLDGPEEFDLAYAMAYNGVASFISTDGHSSEYRQNNLKEMMESFPPDISDENIEIMTHDSAKCVLLDTQLPEIERNRIYKI